MSETLILFGISMGFISMVSVYFGITIREQQKIIDRLTDKLMAKDYREYMSMQSREEPPMPEPPRKGMSWHDDPYIEDEDAH